MRYQDRIKLARKHARLTQDELAERVGIKQASISDLERGKSNSSTHNAKIADVCGVNSYWLETGQGEMLVANQPVTGLWPEHGNQEQPPPSDMDYALIPQYTAKGDCGGGYLNDHVEVKGGLAFKRDWLRRMGAKPENLFVIYAEGDSMEPYIFDGDVVLFDWSDTTPRDRQAYAIRRPDGGISIKRIIQQLSGAWIIRSDNPDKTAYPDEPVTQAVLHEMPILGRVIWRGGAMG